MRYIVSVTLVIVVFFTMASAQTKKAMSAEDMAEFYTQYPYIQVTSRLHTLETEFTWPEGFKRLNTKKLTPYQNWIYNLPLWDSTMPVSGYGGRTLMEPDSISRVIPLPWRTNRLEDYAWPLQIAYEYLLMKKKAESWAVLPIAGDTMTYDKWMVSKPQKDAYGKLMLVPGELRIADTVEYNRFFNLIATNTDYKSLASNCDTVSETDLAPGDLYIVRNEVGHRGRVYMILGIIANDQGDRRFVVATGCPKPACDFHVPLFHNDRSSPWLTLDELTALAPAEYPFRGFFRLRLPVK